MGAAEESRSAPLAVFESLERFGPAWWDERRRTAIEAFEAQGFPTKRWEAWKNIDLSPVLAGDFRPPAHAGDPGDGLAPLERLLPAADAPRVVLIDGRFDAARSRLDDLPAGVTVSSLEDALARGEPWLEEHLAAYADPRANPFVALNTALAVGGVAIRVDDRAAIETPILVAAYTTAGAAGHAVYPRVLVCGGEASQVTVVEWHGGAPGADYLTCPVTELVAGASGMVDLVRIAEEGDRGCCVGAVSGTVARDGRVSAHSFVVGGSKVRLDLEVKVVGDHAEGELTGLHVTGDKQFVDHHTWVHHDAEHTRSRQIVKGVLDGKSETVFDGIIKVHPGAQKTDAEQQNRNLVLSKRALAHSNPRLEIYADDVRCTHGSTVGELDENAIFYLRSRGVDEETARGILTFAFAGDVLETVRCRQAAAYEKALLSRLLPGGEGVGEME